MVVVLVLLGTAVGDRAMVVMQVHIGLRRHHAQAFIDTFAGLGVLPDRYYWMSEHYAAGDAQGLRHAMALVAGITTPLMILLMSLARRPYRGLREQSDALPA